MFGGKKEEKKAGRGCVIERDDFFCPENPRLSLVFATQHQHNGAWKVLMFGLPVLLASLKTTWVCECRKGKDFKVFAFTRVGCCPKFHNSCLSRCFKRTPFQMLDWITSQLYNLTAPQFLLVFFLNMDTLDPMRQRSLALVAWTKLPTAPEMSLFGKDEEEEEKNEEAQLATLNREGVALGLRVWAYL